MIDIHCHILPALDDGAGNMSDAVEMAELAVASGIKGIIATPHCNVSGSFRNFWSLEAESKLNRFKDELQKQNIPLNIYAGQEIYLAPGFIELLRERKLVTLNNSRYLLVEFAVDEHANVAYRKLQQIISEGYAPVVAHPERYGFVREFDDAIYRMKDLGALLQVSRCSLNGKFGSRVQLAAMDIVESFQADFVASDAHSPYKRTPRLADIHEYIAEHFSQEYADVLMKINPEKILFNEKIYAY